MIELYIYYPNLESYQKSFKNLFETKSLSQIKQYLKSLEYENQTVSFQYTVQYEAINELRKLYGDNKNLEGNIFGFYFGNDTCEHLIPSLDEFQDFCKEIAILNKLPDSPRKKSVIFVTPPCGDFGIKKLLPILEFMNENPKGKNEVLINDYGTLNLIEEKFKNLKPVLGRLFNKAQRNPVLGDNVHPQVPSQLGKEVFEKIRQNQKEYYQGNPLDLDIYKDAFVKLGIKRFGIDHAGMGLKKDWANEVSLDLYFPYSMVSCGRNCATRGIHEKTGEWYVQDSPCSKYCRKYDVFLKDGMQNKGITQRGNAIWSTFASFVGVDDEVLRDKNNRLIFQAFIPI